MTDEKIARLRISLDDIEPEIWRTVDMPATGSLKMLHDVIQAAMGWQDYHLWHFEAGDRRYGVPDPEWPDRNLAAARNVKLATLIERGIRQLTYTYDMGDDWRHTVVVEAVGPAKPDTKYPRFVAGERRCPPEDVGGFPGFLQRGSSLLTSGRSSIWVLRLVPIESWVLWRTCTVEVSEPSSSCPNIERV